MKRLCAILGIAFSLTPNTIFGAELSQDNLLPKKLKNAEKFIAFMNTAGVYDERLQKIAYFIDERVDDGYFRVGSVEYHGTTMQFQYEMDRPSVENFQLKFTDQDAPHWELKGSPRGVMLNFHMDF